MQGDDERPQRRSPADGCHARPAIGGPSESAHRADDAGAEIVAEEVERRSLRAAGRRAASDPAAGDRMCTEEAKGGG